MSGGNGARGNPAAASIRAEINRALRKGLAGIEVSKARPAAKRPTRRTTAPPAFTATPGELALVEYTAALTDPWDAGHVGIPYGSPLPTYKQIIFDTFVRHTTVQSTSDWDTPAGTLAATENGVYVGIDLTPNGLQLSVDDGGAGAHTIVPYRNVPISSGRLVAASIRYEYGGRDDAFGGFAEVGRTCFDGQEVLPLDLRRNGMVNYFPRTPFDVEFKDSSGNLNFVTNLSLLIKSVENTAPYRFQVIAIVESNDDTPAPINYTVGDYVTLNYGSTPLAGEKLMNALPMLTAAARDAPFQKSKPSDADPGKWHGGDWLRSLDKAAAMLAQGAVVGHNVVQSLAAAKSMARLAGPAVAMLTAV